MTENISPWLITSILKLGGEKNLDQDRTAQLVAQTEKYLKDRLGLKIKDLTDQPPIILTPEAGPEGKSTHWCQGVVFLGYDEVVIGEPSIKTFLQGQKMIEIPYATNEDDDMKITARTITFIPDPPLFTPSLTSNITGAFGVYQKDEDGNSSGYNFPCNDSVITELLDIKTRKISGSLTQAVLIVLSDSLFKQLCDRDIKLPEYQLVAIQVQPKSDK